MSILQGILLSLLQGATEFLPISSDGHLLLAEKLWPGSLNQADNLAFVVLVHVATLVPICFVFRRRLAELIAFCFRDGWRRGESGGIAARWFSDPRGRMVLAVVIGTLPTGIMGIVAKDYLEGLRSPATLGYQFVFTAFLLALTALRSRANSLETGKADDLVAFPLWMALVVGIAQGVAILPAVSRSGATIAVAILLGMNRRTAGEFSFLLVIPAILGAMLLELKDFDPATTALPLATGVVSFVVAAVSGYVFLRLLLRFIRGGQFSWFSIYCLAVGIWAIVHFN
jgi:undecaprenyl-diphosphatase